MRKAFPKQKPQTKQTIKTLRRLFSYMTKKYKWLLLIVLVGIIISSVVGVIGSMFLEVLIDDYILPLTTMTDPDFSGLWRIILLMAGIYSLGVLASLVFNQLMVIISQGVLKDIRDEMFTHMQYLPLKYFDTHTHGDIMSHYTNDTDTLRQLLSQTLPQFITSLFTVISVFVAMFVLSIPLTVLVILWLIFMFTVTGKIAKRSGDHFLKQQQALGKTNGFIQEMMSGQKVIKVFNREEETKKEFDRLNEELFEEASQANQLANMLMPLMGNLGYFQYISIAVVGGILAINGIGDLSLGTIASFLQLSRSLQGPIMHFSQQLNAIVMALAGAARIFSLLDEKVEVDEGTVTLVNAKFVDGKLVETEERTGIWAWKIPNPDGTYSYTQLKGDVRFEHVDFGYTEDKTVLHDITLYAEPGQKVAFVGATGAGKTTITNLINRFYDINNGKILYDGIDIKRIKKSDLRRSLGMVLQDTQLFTGTIMENIRYGKLDATDEEVYAAAKLAHADGFIEMLPEGYQTEISGDGSSLSQGQRQLLAIARAAIADPPVMILDEATSSIDTRTETIVQRAMDALMQGRTVFVIAHRLSTIQNADVIMVLDQGRIIERGNHEQLLAKKGAYYQLYTGGFETVEA